MPIRVVLVLVMDHLQHDVDDPLHLVVEEQRDVEDHLIAPLHNCKLKAANPQPEQVLSQPWPSRWPLWVAAEL